MRNRYIYMPFGDPGIYNEGPSLRHRFLGEEILQGTGLYVLGARVYDPETGRFLQPDPLVASPADPQSFNRYTYALNNPLSWVDPSGLWTENGPIGGGGGSVPSADVYPRDNPFPSPSGDFFAQWGGGYHPPGVGGGGNGGGVSRPPAESKATHVPVSGSGTGGWTESEAPSSTSQSSESEIGSAAKTAFRWLVYDYKEPLGGSYLLEAATLIPIGKLGKVGKLAERGITVLGHKGQYVERALELGGRYLNVPTAFWERMSEAEKWAANERFLDRAIARGDEFILATQAGAARANSFFARELEYLASKGYRVAEDGLRLIGPGK
jgi:RHS repeat-associated protein